MDTYRLAKNIAQLLIQNALGEGRNLTVDVIQECVESGCEHPTTQGLNQANREKLCRELESEFQTVVGFERELVGRDEGWEQWLPQRRAEINWSFWQRYRTYLEQDSFSYKVLSRLEKSTDRVLGLMGDPQRDGAWDRRGLVVGLVQSGKTAHYIGTISRAVDAGYKVIVVLTGFNENLRIQTQIRLDEGFLGYALKPHPDDQTETIKEIVGVGLVDPNPRRVDSVTTRKSDFRTTIRRNLGIHAGGNPIVFVVKKNVTVLKNLLSWVHNFATQPDDKGQRFVRQIPLLVIDDESDIGSVDTKKGVIDVSGDADSDHDPTKINKQIRKLLSLFDQSSYVGYTATPFANVLIHDEGKADIDPADKLLIGDDLFPRSFIVSLPTPSNHVGPSMIFGTAGSNGSGNLGLPITRDVDDTEIGEGVDDFWIPGSHKKSHVPLFEGRDEIPPSLRKAILSFILVCSARRLRGDGNKHNSMLVHVTRFNDVQERVHDQVLQELQGVVNRLRNGTAKQQLLEEFRDLWETDFILTTTHIQEREGVIFQNAIHAWQDIGVELRAAAEAIDVRIIHGKSDAELDYDNYKEGLSVIAIGGDKLSRGLTLEGLSVSYFLRCSRMYDTLMQMGRWFGYRPGYLDLCRLYTTTDLREWFSHIAVATEELREEFELMANLGSTPKEFGLRVLSHPAMMVTSAVKMRNGTKMTVSFQGTILETIDFSRKPEIVEENWNAGVELVKTMDQCAKKVSSQDKSIHWKPSGDNSALWTNVPTSAVLAFLEKYQEHPAARKVKTRYISMYIEKEEKMGRLTRWHVLLAGGEKEEVSLGSASVKKVYRAWQVLRENDKDCLRAIRQLKDEDHFRIGRLGSPDHEKAGLSEDAIKAALETTIENYEANPNSRRRRPKTPGGPILRQVRDVKEGLLVLYPLSPNDGKAESDEWPILGFVISFPRVHAASATNVAYIVNNRFAKQEELDFS